MYGIAIILNRRSPTPIDKHLRRIIKNYVNLPSTVSSLRSSDLRLKIPYDPYETKSAKIWVNNDDFNNAVLDYQEYFRVFVNFRNDLFEYINKTIHMRKQSTINQNGRVRRVDYRDLNLIIRIYVLAINVITKARLKNKLERNVLSRIEHSVKRISLYLVTSKPSNEEIKKSYREFQLLIDESFGNGASSCWMLPCQFDKTIQSWYTYFHKWTGVYNQKRDLILRNYPVIAIPIRRETTTMVSKNASDWDECIGDKSYDE